MMSELTLYTPEAESFNAFDAVISSLLARTLHLRDHAALLLEDPAFGTNARKKIMQARDQAIRGKAVVHELPALLESDQTSVLLTLRNDSGERASHQREIVLEASARRKLEHL